MSNRIAIYEGYSTPFAAYKKKRKGGSAKQKARFKKAAKACKGKSLKAFRACMRSKLKK